MTSNCLQCKGTRVERVLAPPPQKYMLILQACTVRTVLFLQSVYNAVQVLGLVTPVHRTGNRWHGPLNLIGLTFALALWTLLICKVQGFQLHGMPTMEYTAFQHCDTCTVRMCKLHTYARTHARTYLLRVTAMGYPVSGGTVSCVISGNALTP